MDHLFYLATSNVEGKAMSEQEITHPRGPYLPRQRTPPERRMSDLTDRQLALYDAIVAFKESNDGNPPTTRELSQATGISSSSVVWSYLKAIEKAGYIVIAKGSRNIRVRGGRWTIEKGI
jgi:hypothetical protein